LRQKVHAREGALVESFDGWPSYPHDSATYRCTAACRECCFESSPRVKGFIPAERILKYIDEAARTFPSLRVVVFSGGECFLLGKKLDAAIAQAREHGLGVRCVTNGYWAITPERARKRIQQLKAAGEPPRLSRRLQPLRGLEHEHREAVLT
jgi:pyruvate-formate lyase-activating enzyme